MILEPWKTADDEIYAPNLPSLLKLIVFTLYVGSLKKSINLLPANKNKYD